MTSPSPPPPLPLHDPDAVRALIAHRVRYVSGDEVVVCPVCLRAAYARDLLLHFDRVHLPDLVAAAMSPPPIELVGLDPRGPLRHIALALLLGSGGALALLASGLVAPQLALPVVGLGILYTVLVVTLRDAGWFTARVTLDQDVIRVAPVAWSAAELRLPLTDVEVGPYLRSGERRPCVYVRMVAGDGDLVFALEKGTVDDLGTRWRADSWTEGRVRRSAHILLDQDGQARLEDWLSRRQVLDPAQVETPAVPGPSDAPPSTR